MPFPSSSFLLSLSFPLSFLPALVLFKPSPLPPPLLFLLATLGKYSKRIPGFFSWLLSGRVGRRLVCVYCLFLLYHRRREGGNVFFFFDFGKIRFFLGNWKENFCFDEFLFCGNNLFISLSFTWKQASWDYLHWRGFVPDTMVVEKFVVKIIFIYEVTLG